MLLRLLGKAHGGLIFGRRARILATKLADLLPTCNSVLDIGCGNGVIGNLIQEKIPLLKVEGLEYMARSECLIPCQVFNGLRLPFQDHSTNVCLFVDVLHHAADAQQLLADAVRVTTKYVLIKDHLCENWWDYFTLKVMDWAGNRPHGVVLPFNYRSKAEWQRCFKACHLNVVQWTEELPLYPAPLSWIFGRHLHFIALLEKQP